MVVRWLKKALRNLEQAHTYIAQDDPVAAAQTLLKIQRAVAQLETFPEMGKKGRVEGTRELIISSTSYFVVYRIQKNTIQILRVLHTARKYPDD